MSIIQDYVEYVYGKPDKSSFDDKYKAIVDIVERGGDHRTMRSVLETMCDTNILTQYEAFEIDTKYKLEKETK